MERIFHGRSIILGSIILISACSGGGESGAIDGSLNPVVTQEQSGIEQQALFIPPNDASSLQDALYTRYTSANDFDVWLCTRSGSSAAEVAYSLPVAGTLGEGLIGQEYSLATGAEFSFQWQALSNTELRSTSTDTGADIYTSGYQFSNDNNFSFEINNINLNCDLVNNSVVFGGAPATENTTPTGDVLSPDPAASILGLSSMWFTSDVDALGAINRTYLAFDDGTATHDPEYLTIGRSRSQLEKPDYWKNYYLEESDIVLVGNSGGESRPLLSIRLSPGVVDQRYDGCWKADTSFIPSFSSVVPAIFSSKTYCFSTIGRFANNENAVSSAGGVALTGDTNETGNYQINGHLLTLRGDNGEESVSVFGWYKLESELHNRLVIGKNVYQKQ